MLLSLPSACYNMFSIEMINPNYMTHLDHVVRIIITWSALTKKMQEQSLVPQGFAGFLGSIFRFAIRTPSILWWRMNDL